MPRRNSAGKRHARKLRRKRIARSKSSVRKGRRGSRSSSSSSSRSVKSVGSKRSVSIDAAPSDGGFDVAPLAAAPSLATALFDTVRAEASKVDVTGLFKMQFAVHFLFFFVCLVMFAYQNGKLPRSVTMWVLQKGLKWVDKKTGIFTALNNSGVPVTVAYQVRSFFGAEVDETRMYWQKEHAYKWVMGEEWEQEFVNLKYDSDGDYDYEPRPKK